MLCQTSPDLKQSFCYGLRALVTWGVPWGTWRSQPTHLPKEWLPSRTRMQHLCLQLAWLPWLTTTQISGLCWLPLCVCRSCLFLLFSAMERKSRDMSSRRNKPFSCTVGTESFCVLLTQRSSETGDSQVWKPGSNGMVQLPGSWGVCHCWGTAREERLFF